MNAEQLLTDLAPALREWLPEQRWFAGKGSAIKDVMPVHTAVLHDGDPPLVQAVVAVDSGAGPAERYQLLLGARRELPESLGHAWVSAAGDRVVYDAIHDPELAGRLLELIRDGAEIDGVRFRPEPGAEIEANPRCRPISGEQSNTSLVCGQDLFLKLFRRLPPGPSPDLELHRALARVESPHIAYPRGAIEGELDGTSVTYAMLTDYLANTADGWAMATTSVRDLLAEDGAHPDEVGGDFASEAHRLGAAVATVHADLARALGAQPAGPDYLPELVTLMHARLDGALAVVPELAGHEAALRAAFDAAAAGPPPARLQRVHGDLHLGQVLRSVTGWLLIDFEGEPATPLAERNALTTPLRDVAGMLRSFDYAAQHMLVGEPHNADDVDRALEWAARNREAFCEGYAEVGDDPRTDGALLRALELDKAVYEVGYEHDHRPSWLPIPLASITRMLSAPSSGGPASTGERS